MDHSNYNAASTQHRHSAAANHMQVAARARYEAPKPAAAGPISARWEWNQDENHHHAQLDICTQFGPNSPGSLPLVFVRQTARQTDRQARFVHSGLLGVHSRTRFCRLPRRRCATTARLRRLQPKPILVARNATWREAGDFTTERQQTGDDRQRHSVSDVVELSSCTYKLRIIAIVCRRSASRASDGLNRPLSVTAALRSDRKWNCGSRITCGRCRVLLSRATSAASRVTDNFSRRRASESQLLRQLDHKFDNFYGYLWCGVHIVTVTLVIMYGTMDGSPKLSQLLSWHY